MSPALACVLFLAAVPDGLLPDRPEALQSPAGWYIADHDGCTVSVSDRAPAGVATGSIRIHLPVDHHGGEEKYPVGWPRSGYNPNPAWDWSGYDFLQYWVLVETNREQLPTQAVGAVISTPDRTSQLSLYLPVVQGEWVQYRLPIEDLPDPTNVARVQWYLTEANWAHGDVVDIYLADLALWRYTKPALLAFQPLERLVAVTSGYLPVEAHVVGIPEGERASATVLVRRAGQVLAEAPTDLGRGRQRLVLPLPAGLSPGEAELVFQFEAGQDAAVAPLEIVAGPFAETE